MKERPWIMIAVCLTNAVIVMFFVLMAVYFGKWWMALFSYPCMLNYREDIR